MIRDVLSSVISGVMGGDTPPAPPPQRYFTMLVGLGKFWRRIVPDYGQTTNARLEIRFTGGSGTGTRFLIGRTSGADKLYIALVNSNVVFSNGSTWGLGSTPVDLTKINHVKLVADGTNVTFYVNYVQIAQVPQIWSGLLDSVGFGGHINTPSENTLIYCRVETDTVDDVYPLDKNLAYELPEGVPVTDPLPDSALMFENGAPDGSDRLLVTEKDDGSGFLGEDEWFSATKTSTGQVTVPTEDSITIDEVGGALAAVGITIPSGPITVSGDADLVSGQVDISVIPAFAGVAASITQSGPFSLEVFSAGALGFKRSAGSGAQVTITSIKVEPTYDYASELPAGSFTATQASYFPEPFGGSIETKRHQTNLDGQDDFWGRGESYDISTGDHEIGFEFYVPAIGIGNQFIASEVSPVKTRFSWNNAGAFAFAYGDGSGGTIFVNTSGAGLFVEAGKINAAWLTLSGGMLSMTLNGATTTPIAYSFLETESLSVLGSREGFSFTETSIISIGLDGLITRFSGNAPTEMPIGNVAPSLSDFTYENGEPDGSDRELVTRKANNTGWVGSSIDYDYATGANN